MSFLFLMSFWQSASTRPHSATKICVETCSLIGYGIRGQSLGSEQQSESEEQILDKSIEEPQILCISSDQICE